MEAGSEYVRSHVSETEERMTTQEIVPVEETLVAKPVEGTLVAKEEMLRDAEAAAEPGDMKEGQVVGRSEEMGDLRYAPELSAGYVYVYHMQSGSRSTINRNMLPQQLEKRHIDGTYLFSTRKPDIQLAIGNLKCILHADDPDRKKYDRMGLVVCGKQRLLSELDRENHMRRRHRRAWATIENERVREERESDRTERRAMAEILKTLTQQRGK
jgi:hypothetical protein